MNYRKLTNEEVLELANRIKHGDDINFDLIRERIPELFGEKAHKVVLYFSAEYNDESYDLRPNEITVFTADGKKLKPLDPEAWENQDHYDLAYDLEISLGYVESAEDLGEVAVYINETKGLDLP